jgi:hypothetical protein
MLGVAEADLLEQAGIFTALPMAAANSPRCS